MSVALTSADQARKNRAAKNKGYQAFPLGREWKEFLRAKRVAGRRSNTLESYETVGDKFARYFEDFADLMPFVAEPELILDFLEDQYPNVDPDTFQQRFAVMGSFFRWAYKTDRIINNPVEKIERPQRRRKEAARSRIPEADLSALTNAQETMRDKAAIMLLGRLGLRREDLRMLQLEDIDLATDEIRLNHGKGGKKAVLPLAFKPVQETLYLHLQERGGRPDEYLLYPWNNRHRPLSAAGIDKWFKRCLERAELTNYTMHQLRHAAIDEVRRQTHDVELARALGRHSNSAVTQAYLHTEIEDLRTALEAMEVG